MKLQKQLSRKVGTKEYQKWVLNIPTKVIEDLGWKEGQNLKTQVTSKGLLVTRTKVCKK